MLRKTTDDSVTLTWTYDKDVSRLPAVLHAITSGWSARKELHLRRSLMVERHDDGTYTFSYTDKNLFSYRV